MSRKGRGESVTTGVEQGVGSEHRVPESPYLLASEAARYLRYATTRALYDAIPQLNIPCHRRGGKTLLFDRRELDAWIRDSRPSRQLAAQQAVARKLNLVRHDDTVNLAHGEG